MEGKKGGGGKGEKGGEGVGGREMAGGLGNGWGRGVMGKREVAGYTWSPALPVILARTDWPEATAESA